MSTDGSNSVLRGKGCMMMASLWSLLACSLVKRNVSNSGFVASDASDSSSLSSLGWSWSLVVSWSLGSSLVLGVSWSLVLGWSWSCRSF